MEFIMKNKGSLKLFTIVFLFTMSPRKFPDMLRNILYSKIFHLANFDVTANCICYFTENIWHHNYSIFQLLIWMEKFWEEVELQKIEYLENEKSFLGKVKSIAHMFWGLTFSEI